MRQEMMQGRLLTGSVNGYTYSGSVSADRPASDYTPRIVPRFENVAIPLEAGQILWQR